MFSRNPFETGLLVPALGCFILVYNNSLLRPELSVYIGMDLLGSVSQSLTGNFNIPKPQKWPEISYSDYYLFVYANLLAKQPNQTWKNETYIETCI